MSPPAPLILTLALDEASFALLDGLRRQHFPRERNFLSAHVTLFHHLPGDKLAAVAATLEGVCNATPPLELNFPAVRFLGRGVAVEVDCPALVDLQQQLARGWQDWLNAQDRQRFKPHVTVQNKVPAPRARELYQQMLGDWQPRTGRGEGLLLWRYLGGPWEAVEDFPFRG